MDTRSHSAANYRAANDPSVFTITGKAPTRAFSQLKAPASATTFKTLCHSVIVQLRRLIVNSTILLTPLLSDLVNDAATDNS